MSARPLRVNHMKPKPFFTDQAVGLVLKRRINATPQESSDAAQRRSHALSEDLKKNGQMKQNGRKEVQTISFQLT